jgi:TetR/AcrR family transcriptional regulator, fatty acid metabolism regulator protein
MALYVDSQPQTKGDLIRDFRVRQILDSVYAVVGERGFKGTTMSLVAKNAGIAKGTIYVYFKSKSELLSAAIEFMKMTFAEELGAKIEGIQDPVERLHIVLRAELELSDARRDFIKRVLLERNFLAASPRNAEARQALDMYLSGRLLHERIIQKGVSAGVFRRHDVTMSALTLYQAVAGLFELRVLRLNKNTFGKDAKLLMDVLLHGILAANQSRELVPSASKDGRRLRP